MMDKNVKAIKAFIVGKESQNLTIRQDDRIIALAALPFVGFSILFLFLWYWMRKKSKEYPSTTA